MVVRVRLVVIERVQYVEVRRSWLSSHLFAFDLNPLVFFPFLPLPFGDFADFGVFSAAFGLFSDLGETVLCQDSVYGL